MTKEKITAVFARLDRLGLERDGGHSIDSRESARRANLFTLVSPTPRYSIPLTSL